MYCRICNSATMSMSICNAQKKWNMYRGLQIRILKTFGLQIQMDRGQKRMRTGRPRTQ